MIQIIKMLIIEVKNLAIVMEQHGGRNQKEQAMRIINRLEAISSGMESAERDFIKQLEEAEREGKEL